VQKGKTFFSPPIAKHFDPLNPLLSGRAGTINPTLAQLTSREMEVLQLMPKARPTRNPPLNSASASRRLRNIVSISW